MLLRPILRRLGAPVELGHGWRAVEQAAAGLAPWPTAAEVFLVVWEDRTAGTLVGTDFLASTAGAFPAGCDAFVVASATVQAPARSRDAWAAASAVASFGLARQFESAPAFRQIWERYVADRRKGATKPALPVDVVPEKDWQEMVRRLGVALPAEPASA